MSFAARFAAGLVLIVVGGWAIWRNGWRNALPVAGADEQLGTIVRKQDAWHALADQPFRAGQALGAGRIDLAAGLLELVMSGGVSIVLEGPAELEPGRSRVGPRPGGSQHNPKRRTGRWARRKPIQSIQAVSDALRKISKETLADGRTRGIQCGKQKRRDISLFTDGKKRRPT